MIFRLGFLKAATSNSTTELRYPTQHRDLFIKKRLQFYKRTHPTYGCPNFHGVKNAPETTDPQVHNQQVNIPVLEGWPNCVSQPSSTINFKEQKLCTRTENTHTRAKVSFPLLKVFPPIKGSVPFLDREIRWGQTQGGHGSHPRCGVLDNAHTLTYTRIETQREHNFKRRNGSGEHSFCRTV